MKKLISIVLMLVLIFAMAVPSFAVGSVTVSNWPTWFTGQYDNSILGALQDTYNWLSSTLYNAIDGIYGQVGDINQHAIQMEEDLNTISELLNGQSGLVTINNLLSAIDSSVDSVRVTLSADLWDIYDNLNGNLLEWHDETLSAIGGVTSAVGALNSDFNTYHEDWEYQYENTTVKGTAGYAFYMLQQVLADEDDLAFKDTNKSQKDEVLNFAEAGVSSDEAGGSFSFFDSAANSINGANTLFEFLDIGFSIDDLAIVLGDLDDALIWFSEENYTAINGVQTFADDSPEIVTHYYSDKQEELSEILGGLRNG